MTVEAKTDFSRKPAPDWAPSTRRQGERAPWETLPERAEENRNELVLSPPIWPRIFPGI